MKALLVLIAGIVLVGAMAFACNNQFDSTLSRSRAARSASRPAVSTPVKRSNRNGTWTGAYHFSSIPAGEMSTTREAMLAVIHADGYEEVFDSQAEEAADWRSLVEGIDEDYYDLLPDEDPFPVEDEPSPEAGRSA